MADDTSDTKDCARRSAKRVGLAIRKSRPPTLHDNNHGHFMLFDRLDNQIIWGRALRHDRRPACRRGLGTASAHAPLIH
jgi:hypothetical protein